ncbi:histone acetyltransferase HAC1-like isoform X2 [Salvia miltiorrhiza]|uniref:histone acetyltransferase HAC1-like isoform X2 n=1 Tax=Salvia miltiorrhiza TaxID=226208 RepID=UPI0025ACEACA|nr:histone acetyltransferase HAC1-like isoform X2 [Salvia miltiorrhiza]
MNLQTHHSGQFSGQVPNQAGTMLPGLPQQNGNPMPNQMQNPSMHRSVQNTDHEYMKTRRYMQEKIWEFLMQRRQQSHEVSQKKMLDLVKRLEEALFKSATTTDEYLNLATLESRLHVLIKRLPMSNHNQQFSHANSSPSIGTMIPTPGLQQSGNSNINGTQSVDSSLIVNNNSNTIGPSSVNSGNYMLHGNGSSSHVHGALSGGYQQSSSAFSVNSGGNSMVTSMGAQRMASQMMPTPGFNNSNSSEVNNNANNQSFMNMESSNNVGAFQAGESSIISQPMQQKQRIIGQNSRILHNIGGHMGGGIRSTLQQKSYGLSNGPLNGGLGMMGNNMSMMNGPGTTEGYLSGTVYGNSNKPMHQNFDQQQRPVMQGDGYGINASEASGSGNLYSSVGSMMNNQSLNAVSMQSMPKSNSPMMINSQSHVHSVQQATTTVKPQPIDQSEKMNFQAQYSIRENLAQPHQHQQLQQQSHQFQRQQLVQNQVQQKLNQNQLVLKNETFGQSHLSTNMYSEAKPGHGSENRDEGIQSQGSDPFHFSDIHSQFQHNSMEDQSRSQMLSHQSGPQDVTSSLTQSSDQMQQFLHPQQFPNSESDFGGPPGGIQPDAALHGQWYSNSQDVSHVSGRLTQDQNVQDEFQNRLVGQDVAQLNNLSSEESIIGQSDASRSAEPPSASNAMRRSNNLNRERQFKNQQRWLLFLRHARRCPAPEGKCQESNCLTVQKLLKHMEHCNVFQCPYPRCCATRVLLNHHRRCRDASCPVCVPVKSYVQQAQMKAFARAEINSRQPNSVNGSGKSYDAAEAGVRPMPKMSPVIPETPEDLQPAIKRMKSEQAPQPVVSETGTPVALPFAVNESPIQDAQHPEQYHDSHIHVKHESTQVKMEIPGSLGQLNSKNIEMKRDNLDDKYVQKPAKPEGDTIASKNPVGYGTHEVVKSEKEMGLAKMENPPLPSESTSKSGKPKIKGVSLTELFTPEQVRQHIAGLRRWVGQSKAKAEKNQAMEHSMSENSCQLCAVEKLTFEPPPIYCTPCGARIKRNAMYYTIGAGETRHFFCIPCYNEARGDTVVVDGTTIPKARMEKKKNDEETEEWWVQCDKCEAWQHQICALFNGRRNDGGQAEYTCPNCYMEEVERGERVPLPQSAVLGAKDLPRTILSDHMEQRLFTKLKQERQDRARAQGKSYDEIPGAESLVVRVVSSVDKKLEVKPRFLEIFQEDNFPMEFPYKSKVILLFQKIEGVEVCLFGMYVQEFGSECQQPNHRRVYLSYLDSVKYFRPDVKAVTGEALRTYVYHEILIGYLDYCKKRGFTSCYIWACPPLKGEDYILYCHPEIQKTPKSDKLREWYLAMLRKAAKENIVVELTNLYDHFFVTTAECRAKVTASRLPYFDGDYWPGAAEDIIFQLQQDEDGRKQHKKGTLKKTITKRALKASGQTDLSGNASKDLMLMHKLGETILPMKEDFIMVHLQRACSHCCILMFSGKSWACRQCKNFQLCERCYDLERKRDDRERHPINQKDKHLLYPVEINGVPDDTKDQDEILESEFFDTRQAFLSLCQGNHYQYDTLRRAKHSSMMVLYHLHNPTAPAFVTTCNVCHLDIETGQGWRCETCPDYDVCNQCYSKDGGIDHPHVLTNHPSNDRDAQNKEARQLRVTQLRKMLDLLVHASQCRSPHCQYPNCRKVKGLFRHGMLCKVRASGGCVLCKKMWYLLQLHARACKESECNVPRCRDLKEHMRRLQQQSDSRRRAAVMEMMRQRAAEVASSS